MSQYRAFSRDIFDRRFFSLAFMVKYTFHCPLGSADNDRNSFFDNSCFLFGDFRQCVTQILDVVPTDIGNDTQIGGG